MDPNPQATELNQIIEQHNKAVYELLSGRGKHIFFPKKGILAQSADAKGKDINATIGIALEEDGSPMRLKPIAKLVKKLPPQDVFPYASSFGKQELREKWKQLIKEKNPSLNSKISMPVVTNAITHGLSMAGYLFVSPGDKIITPDLFWGNYKLIFQNTYGGELDTFNTFKDNRFDVESLRKKLTEGEPGKKVLVLNFPNNPTGYTPTEGEVGEIVKAIEDSAKKGNNIAVIVDDAYFGLVYREGIFKQSIFAKLADLHENVLAVKLDGGTKEDYIWGLRTGFVTFGVKGGNKQLYESLESKLAGAVRGTISNVSHLSQSLLLEGLKSKLYEKEKQKKYELLRTRYEKLKETLQDEKYAKFFTPLPFNSGYFMCIKLKDVDAEKVRQILLEKYSTGVIALDNKLRIAFSSVKTKQIPDLFENIYDACKDASGFVVKQVNESVLSSENKAKLEALNNQYVIDIVQKYIKHCKPSKVTVITDSQEDIEYIRNLTLENGEEEELKTKGHTIHFDGYKDQGRDLENTRVLVPEGVKLSKAIKTRNREEGLREVHEILEGIMEGKEMLILFYSLGPNNSKFTIPALQITDSAYVAHSENILYRQGFEEFKRLNGSDQFFYFVHSAGKLDKRNTSVDVAKRRVYMDVQEGRVFTVNNQYAGNSVGLKKLALRLAISKASKEDWLCEHMFIMGIHPEGKNRTTYLTGAFPTACGKTSTAMVSGQTIVGDDIAYIRPGEDGRAYAVNVEQGIFGIIKDINPEDDPIIYKALATPRELIFSNILISDGKPYWLGMGKDDSKVPRKGQNHSGQWFKGKRDEKDEEIPFAHKNARYTIRINELENTDEKADSPDGVPVSGFIYGGRDSSTSVPVAQSLSWSHGVFMGAMIESETVAGTSDKEGMVKHNPMSNIEFLTVPLGTYISNHLRFGESLDAPPLIFSTNYFLQKNGNFVNSKLDKKIWLLWMEGRTHNEYDAIETPIGFIPKYEDLRELFHQVFQREYTAQEYTEQFSIKTRGYIEKLDRLEQSYRAESNIPELFFTHIDEQKERLKQAQEQYEKTDISPFDFSGETVVEKPEIESISEEKPKKFFEIVDD